MLQLAFYHEAVLEHEHEHLQRIDFVTRQYFSSHALHPGIFVKLGILKNCCRISLQDDLDYDSPAEMSAPLILSAPRNLLYKSSHHESGVILRSSGGSSGSQAAICGEDGCMISKRNAKSVYH